jgi:hypothetical protein
MIDLAKLTDASGKPIDTSKVDPSLLALMTAAFGGLKDAVAGVVTEAIKPVSEDLTKTFDVKLAELAKKPPADPANPNPNPNPKPGDKPGDKKDDVDPSQPPAWFKDFADKVNKLSETIEGDRTRATVTQQATAYLDKNLPRATPEARKLLVDAIVAANPKDENAIKSVIEAERQRAIAYGADKANPFGVDPKAEGGRAADPDVAKAAEQEKLDGLAKRLEEKRRA